MQRLEAAAASAAATTTLGMPSATPIATASAGLRFGRHYSNSNACRRLILFIFSFPPSGMGPKAPLPRVRWLRTTTPARAHTVRVPGPRHTPAAFTDSAGTGRTRPCVVYRRIRYAPAACTGSAGTGRYTCTGDLRCTPAACTEHRCRYVYRVNIV